MNKDAEYWKELAKAKRTIRRGRIAQIERDLEELEKELEPKKK